MVLLRLLGKKLFGGDDFQIGHFAFDYLKIVNVISYEECVFLFDDNSGNQRIGADGCEFCLRGDFVDVKTANCFGGFPPIIFGWR